MTAAPQQMHLAAHFPVDDTTVWDDPLSGSQIEFASFAHLARTAERGLFDFLLLAEGPGLREHGGLVHDLDVAGRPDPLTVLPALAAVTDRLGLAASAGAALHEPYELARRFATLDHLSAGRSAWNVVTSEDPFASENVRRAGRPDRADGTGTPAPPSSSPRPAGCGTPGRPTVPRAPSPTAAGTSRPRASSPSRAPRRGIPSSSGQRTARRTASSPRPPPTSFSPGTAPRGRAARSVPTSGAGSRSTAGSPAN